MKFRLLFLGCCLAFMPRALCTGPNPDFKIQLDTITKGYDGKKLYDGKYCWVHPRAAAIPRDGQPPVVVVTMQQLFLEGADIFFSVFDMRTEDMGKTWIGPTEHAKTLGRIPGKDGTEEVPCGMIPKYHAKTGKILNLGWSSRYKEKIVPVHEDKSTVYSVYDEARHEWSRWEKLEVPKGDLFWKNSASGCSRVDLPNGEILQPVYFKVDEQDKFFKVKVIRMAFDGYKLKVLEEGPAIKLDTNRGFQEPSLAFYNGKFYLTLRHDKAGYVATSNDGLNFSEPIKWLWDDGTELGTYNTQTRWVTHSDGLFLVYTRRGANNDHVLRHRAPLFIGQVDPETLRVIRSTERILIPERGARLGNFGVCNINEHETWVTDSEWMQQAGPEYIIPADNPKGADGSVYAARILWDKPNKTWDKN